MTEHATSRLEKVLILKSWLAYNLASRKTNEQSGLHCRTLFGYNRGTFDAVGFLVRKMKSCSKGKNGIGVSVSAQELDNKNATTPDCHK